jgi:aminoglycoside/choline kinase family phosphotransferase
MSDHERLQRLLDAVRAALPARFGEDAAILGHERIPGQASNRRYHRLTLSGATAPASIILVQLPDDPFASEEAAGDEGERILPFCAMLRFLDSRGLPVPELYLDATADGYLLQEDLGATTLFRVLQDEGIGAWEEAYRKALQLLVSFQEQTVEPPAEGPPCIGFDRRFTRELLRWELDHFKEWLLLDHAGAVLAKAADRSVEAHFDALADRLHDSPYRLAHRDYQSTNLMVRGDALYLIDFQDALMAPPTYDIVALLRDSYVSLPDDMLDRLLGYYYGLAAELLPFGDEEAFRSHFHLQTLQRKLKDAGRFVFIDRVKGNPGFLQWIEPTLGYVRQAFGHLPEYRSLNALLAEHVPALAEP